MKKMPESFCNLLPFFEPKIFQIFGQVLSAGLPNIQISCQASFSRVMINFGKSSCFILVFRVWAEEFRFLSQFLAAFRKLHSLCFKVKNTKLSPVNFGPWVKDYETIGCVSFGRALKYAFWLSRWKTNRSKNI